VQSPDGEMGIMTSFAALTKNVPMPFKKEFSGGPGMHIHDKFVVVDFNAGNPTVFSGSSNLAAGGETANGDSLAMIQDAAIANMYAIEAVALFDHYHYRSKVRDSTAKAQPLTLWYPGKQGMPVPWWKGYYNNTDIKLRDRCLFANIPLPAGLEATKNPDWSALDAAAVAPKSKGGGKKQSGKAQDAAGASPGAKKAKKAAKASATKTGKKAAKTSAKKAPKKAAAGKKASKGSGSKKASKKAGKKTAKSSAKKTAQKKGRR